LPPAGPFVKATLAVFGRDLARNRKKEKIDVAEAGMPMRRLLIAAAILPIHGVPAEALLLWNWRYSGAGVSASGTFTTNDATDGVGFYQIVGISGADNGVRISGLQPTGTAISGNEPYVVDNLVSAAEPHLTTHGFGFSLANGNYANPFYKTSSYYEHLSVPPYINGAGPERPVAFSAAIVPEPSAASLQLRGPCRPSQFRSHFAPVKPRPYERCPRVFRRSTRDDQHYGPAQRPAVYTSHPRVADNRKWHLDIYHCQHPLEAVSAAAACPDGAPKSGIRCSPRNGSTGKSSLQRQAGIELKDRLSAVMFFLRTRIEHLGEGARTAAK
jgi:hypothetical protein